jgi:hypothetical protein
MDKDKKWTKCLEGLVTEQMIQNISKKESQTNHQVEVAQFKLEAFEASLNRPE